MNIKIGYPFQQYKRLASTCIPLHNCILCDQRSPLRLCTDCLPLLRRPHYSCQRCGLPTTSHTPRCGDCLRRPPAYDRVFSPFIYQAPLSQLIIKFKNEGTGVTAKVLKDLFSLAIAQDYAQQHIPLPDFIIPVPLHWQRQWSRGFNQAEILGNALSDTLTLPQHRLLKRVTRGVDQKNLSRQQRLLNLKNSFTLKRPDTVVGKTIALVDDIMTTGATANTLAKCLKTAGAQEVIIWVLARTPFNLGPVDVSL